MSVLTEAFELLVTKSIRPGVALLALVLAAVGR